MFNTVLVVESMKMMLCVLYVAAFLFKGIESIDPITTSIRFNHGKQTEVLYSSVGSSSGSRISGFKDNDDSDIVFGGLFAVYLSAIGGGECSEVIISRGVERVEAMLYAIDTINSDPTLLPNITLGYDIRDTCMSFNIALDETADLLLFGRQLEIGSCTANNETDSLFAGVVGASASFVSRPVASLLRIFQIPQVSYSSSSPLLSNRDRYSYFFRTIPPDDQQAQAIFDLIIHFNWDHISLVYSNNDYGEPIGQLIQRLSQSGGVCVDLNEAIDVDFTTSDFVTLAQKINNSTANVIVLFASINDVKNLLREVNNVYANGGRSDFTWIAGDSWVTNQNVMGEYPNITAGLWGTAPFTTPYAPFDEYLLNLTQNRNLRNPWFNDDYINNYYTNCTMQSSCDELSLRGQEEYAQDPVAPLVIDAVYSIAHAIQNFYNDNCREPFTWNSANNTCRGQNKTLNGENLLPYIQNTSFTSVTGNKVMFDSSGSVAAKYRIYNYQVKVACRNCTDTELVEVGVWDGSLSTNQLQLYNISKQFGINHITGQVLYSLQSNCQICSPGHYKRPVTSSCCGTCDPCLGSSYTNTNSSTSCMTCPANMWGNNPLSGSTHCIDINESYLKPSDPWGIVLILLAVIGLLAVVFVTSVFIWFWNTPIVKSSGREQMILVLIGLTLCFILSVFYLLPPSPVSCAFRRIFLWFSYSLILCALFIKLVRLARIFLRKNISSRPKFISPVYQVIFTLLLVSVQLILVIASMIYVPPDTLNTTNLNENNQNDYPTLILQCTAPHVALVVLQMLYFTALLIASNVLAILTIRFPENFNESKYVASATFALGVLWLGFISGYFASDVINQTAIISFTVQVSALAVLVCLFGPRVFLMIFLPGKNVVTMPVTDPMPLSGPRASAGVIVPHKNGTNNDKTAEEEL